jgi:hypothetical protein
MIEVDNVANRVEQREEEGCARSNFVELKQVLAALQNNSTLLNDSDDGV